MRSGELREMTHWRRIRYWTSVCSDQPSVSLEFGDGFDRVTGRQDFGVVGVELVGGGGGASEGAVALFVETIGNYFDGVGEETVVVGDCEGQTSFNGGELG